MEQLGVNLELKFIALYLSKKAKPDLNLRTVRAFVAIELPLSVKQTIAQIQSSLKSLCLQISWVKPENSHLTLKFLGDVQFNQLKDIRKRLSQGSRNYEPFHISLGELGVFPNWDCPRIIWIGVKDNTQYLNKLWSMVESKLEEFGPAKNTKVFKPHLTLARVKSHDKNKLLKKRVSALLPLSIEPFESTEIKLYKSQLTPKGSIYTVLETFPLGKS